MISFGKKVVLVWRAW